MHQPSMAVVESSGAETLGHERIKAKEQPHRKYAHAHEDRASDADSADRLRAKASDHEGIDDAHRNPAEFGEDDGRRQCEHRLELAAQITQRQTHASCP
jgi:hypothetical protein